MTPILAALATAAGLAYFAAFFGLGVLLAKITDRRKNR